MPDSEGRSTQRECARLPGTGDHALQQQAAALPVGSSGSRGRGHGSGDALAATPVAVAPVPTYLIAATTGHRVAQSGGWQGEGYGSHPLLDLTNLTSDDVEGLLR
jgi:hypothetical protein